MSGPPFREVRQLFQFEKVQAFLAEHLQEVEGNVLRSTERYVRDLDRQLGDPYGELPTPSTTDVSSLQEIIKEDPFVMIPLDAQDLQVSSTVPSFLDIGFANPSPMPYKGSVSQCQTLSIAKGELSGHPLKAEEIHDGPTDWPPLQYTWVQPKLGRIEAVSAISSALPGRHQAGSFSYNLSSAHLAAAHLLAVNEPRHITIRAQPWLSGLVAHGSGNSWKDVSGYSVTLTLSATAVAAGVSDSDTVVPGNSVGVVLGWPYAVKVQYWPTLSVDVETVGYDLVFITITLTAVTLQKTGSNGYALVDVDGATSPPGKCRYYSTGCLDLPGFVVQACAPQLASTRAPR